MVDNIMLGANQVVTVETQKHLLAASKMHGLKGSQLDLDLNS